MYGDRIGELTNSGVLSVVLMRAPEELKMALSVVINSPVLFRVKDSKFNETVRKALGFDRCRLNEYRNYDFTHQLKSILGSA